MYLFDPKKYELLLSAGKAYDACSNFIKKFHAEEDMETKMKVFDVIDEAAFFLEKCDDTGIQNFFEGIRTVAYEKYKQQWFSSQDMTGDLMDKTVADYMEEMLHLDESEKCTFSDWLFERGFHNGNIYVCYGEFLDAEYQDKEYMQNLLNEDEYEIYLQDLKNFEEE